jgi:hypothetical protein
MKTDGQRARRVAVVGWTLLGTFALAACDRGGGGVAFTTAEGEWPYLGGDIHHTR